VLGPIVPVTPEPLKVIADAPSIFRPETVMVAPVPGANAPVFSHLIVGAPG